MGYFNINAEKGKHLKLSEQANFEQENEFLAKKEQPEHRCSDCTQMARDVESRLNRLIIELLK